jgi:hypothetical protein
MLIRCLATIASAFTLVLLSQKLCLAGAPLACRRALRSLPFDLLKERLAHTRFGVVACLVDLGLGFTAFGVLLKVGVVTASLGLRLGHLGGHDGPHTATCHHFSTPFREFCRAWRNRQREKKRNRLWHTDPQEPYRESRV